MAVKKKAKRQRGRPSMLTPESKKKAFKAAAEGALGREIAEVIGIHPGTLCEWKTTYPEFAEELRKHQDTATKAVEAALFRSAIGYSYVEEIETGRGIHKKKKKVVKQFAPNPTSIVFWLKNRSAQKWRDIKTFDPSHGLGGVAPQHKGKVTFLEFCANAGYPQPFPKQEEMRQFVFGEEGAALLLGTRGIGKTDYITVLGNAYEIYLDPLNYTSLIVTKSKERNGAILEEAAKALVANGIELESRSKSYLRVKGLHGKDHSASAITNGASSFRGRHPKRVIMDDPVTDEDTREATRKRVQTVYNELNKLTKNVTVIGQPVHKYDLYEMLRPIIRRKMEVPHGQIPELDHDLEAQRLAGVTEDSIQKSYFLNVKSEEASPFDRINYVDEFPEGDSVAFIDPSFRGGDYTAVTIGRGYFDGVVIQGHVFKKAWYHCIDDMAAHLLARGVKRVCFETNSLGEQPVTLLRETLKDSGIGVVGKDSQGSKHARIVNAGSFAHLIHLAKTSDRLYLDHVTKYEYGAEFDDAPDSLAGLLEWLGLIRGGAGGKKK